MPALAAAVVLAVGPGCGGGDSASPSERRLSPGERAAVTRSIDSIHAYCRQVQRYVGRQGPPPAAQAGERAQRAVAEIIAVARTAPDAEYALSQPMRTLVGDTAENLEATNCSSQLVRLLQRGLAELPAAGS